MPKKPGTQYVISRSEQSIFTEIYFPKRSAYYGTIFDALRFGYDVEYVKEYMGVNIEPLLEEAKETEKALLKQMEELKKTNETVENFEEKAPSMYT